METYDYKVILEPDETGGYVISCPSLPGCYSQGETIKEALANIKEAISLCLEDMRSDREVAILDYEINSIPSTTPRKNKEEIILLEKWG